MRAFPARTPPPPATHTVLCTRAVGEFSTSWRDRPTKEGFVGKRDENGMAQGHCTQYRRDGGRYEGEFMNNQAHGKGSITFVSGAKYEGMWQMGNMHGPGTYYWPNGEADVLIMYAGKPCGAGVRYSANRSRVSQLHDGKRVSRLFSGKVRHPRALALPCAHPRA